MTSQGLERELECPVCFDRFNIPKVLPCQHTFCANCLNDLNERGNVRCPECRVIHTVPPNGFPINITIQRLLSASEIPNVPDSSPGNPQPLQPTAPPLQPPSSRLPPVYPPQLQPIPEIPSHYHEPNPPQHPHNHPPQSNFPSGQNTSSYGGHVPPAYGSQVRPLPSIQTHRESSETCQSSRAAESGNYSGDDSSCKTTFLKYFQLTREGVRKVISNFLRKYHNFMAVTTIIFLIITFSRFVAGAVKLSSNCPKEQQVAEYLFVKACIAFVFWGVVLVLRCKERLIKSLDNKCVEVYVVLETLFSLIWLIIGTVWIIGFRDEMIAECPLYDYEWDKHFITFAFFLTVVDWIGVAAFMLFFCYVQCDNSEDT